MRSDRELEINDSRKQVGHRFETKIHLLTVRVYNSDDAVAGFRKRCMGGRN